MTARKNAHPRCPDRFVSVCQRLQQTVVCGAGVVAPRRLSGRRLPVQRCGPIITRRGRGGKHARLPWRLPARQCALSVGGLTSTSDVRLHVPSFSMVAVSRHGTDGSHDREIATSWLFASTTTLPPRLPNAALV
jgi:hypothetical protein